MSRYEVVLLDIDGTLVDSNDAHAQAWVAALGSHGYDVNYAEVREAIGMGGDKILARVIGVSDDTELGKSISDRRKQIFRDRFLPDVQPFPNVRALLERMKEEGLRLVVATSASEEEVEPLLRKAKVLDLVEAATSKDDAEHSKPDPDIVQAALRQAGVSADKAVMLGDTPYDVAAAAAAGVTIVTLRCGGWEFPEGSGAAAVFDDPADMLRYFELSPLGRP